MSKKIIWTSKKIIWMSKKIIWMSKKIIWTSLREKRMGITRARMVIIKAGMGITKARMLVIKAGVPRGEGAAGFGGGEVDRAGKAGYTGGMMAGKKALALLGAAVGALLTVACGVFSYGELGGSDKTVTVRPGDERFDGVMELLSGVWYSHYAGVGRLDGYRIGKWAAFDALMAGKTGLFSGLEGKTYTAESGTDTPVNGDYFVFYDDTVFGQADDGAGGNGGWDGLVTRYAGIVRAVNIFNGDPSRGAVIIEYLKGGVPLWDRDLKDGSHPFFGIYYRVLDTDTVQMANAVDLAALYRGEKYYTETGTLAGAVGKNNVENEAEFISWGVVIPQDREK
jgi:hypothetical protein